MTVGAVVIDKEGRSMAAPWKGLHRAGSAAAVAMCALIPIGAIPFVIAPRPDTVGGWFTLLHNNRLLGLALLDLPNLAVNLLAPVMFLALWAALRSGHESTVTMMAALGVVAAGLYVASNPACAMLALNDQYTAAVSEAQRATLLAAGQSVLTIYQSSTAFNVSYVGGALVTLVLSALMVRSPVFGRAAGYAGMVASVVTLGLYVPGIGLYISVLSLLPYAAWLLLVARGLHRMGRA